MKKRNRDNSSSHNIWRSYSDLMAGILLLFILIMCVTLFQAQKNYDDALHEKEQKEKVSAKLLDKEESINKINNKLKDKDLKLEEQKELLRELEQTLDAQKAKLKKQSKSIKDKENQLKLQREKIDNIIGVKAEVVDALSQEFSKNNIKVNIDKHTGAVTLSSNVLFNSNEADLTDGGKKSLHEILPIYLKVLLEPKYKPYLAEIIIDGYTDNDGSYDYNLELSQKRSLAVANYLLSVDSEFLNDGQKSDLENYLTVNGHSSANLIKDANGEVNKEASRRVEIKFRLKDDQMIEELNKILKH